jgi:acetate kinase
MKVFGKIVYSIVALLSVFSAIPANAQQNTDSASTAGLTISPAIFELVGQPGQMAAVLDGADTLVFTGTVGERSAPIRSRVAKKLGYLNFTLDTEANKKCTSPTKPTALSRHARIKPVIVVPADEARQIARHALNA